MRKYLWMALVIIASGILLSASFLFTTRNQTTPTPDIIVDTIPTSGTVVWYTSIPQQDAERLANAFMTEKGIAVQIVRASTFTIRDRLMSEIASGANTADVLTIADIATYAVLRNQGDLMYYDSPEYASYSKQFKDEGYWAVFSGFGICMAYNEKLTTDLPQQWTDLLDARWKGKIGIEDISTAGSQYGQYYMLREALGVGFWEKFLSTQQPKIYTTTAALADALVSGEIEVAAEFSTNTLFSYRNIKGISIQGIYPVQGIPMVVKPSAILSEAPHPDEARIFQDFLLSQKGQTIMQNTIYEYSFRDGVEPNPGMKSMDELYVLLPEDAQLYGSQRNAYIQEFNDFLGGNQ